MKYIKSSLIGLSIFLILNLIITIISYFDILDNNIIDIFKSISLIIAFLSIGISIGLQYKKKSLINKKRK